MEEKIYIVEALHELPILHDRINKNKEKLQEYSSGVSNITPVFGTEQEQRNYVAALMQSTKALLERYLWLKRCIAYTNAMSKVEICKRAYSIVELISLRQEMGGVMSSVYDCLSLRTGERMYAKLTAGTAQQAGPSDGGKAPLMSPILFYDEAKKNREKDEWFEFCGKITSALEIFNARTYLLDPDEAVPPKETAA